MISRTKLMITRPVKRFITKSFAIPDKHTQNDIKQSNKDEEIKHHGYDLDGFAETYTNETKPVIRQNDEENNLFSGQQPYDSNKIQ